MKRKEEIEQKAYELSKIAFPNERNMWARSNFEAQIVKSCCISIAEWADRTMLDKVCEWLEDNIYDYLYINRDFNEADYKYGLIEDLRKAMEE